MKRQFEKLKDIFSPPRDEFHGDEDDDFQTTKTPNKGYVQDPTMQHTKDPTIKSTINSYPPNPNNPEFSNQNNYSANVKINGQAEQEEGEIELQYGNSNDGVKQTCRTLSDAFNSDLNSTNIHPRTPQRSVQYSHQIQRQQQQNYLQQHGGMSNIIGNLYEQQVTPHRSIMTTTETPIPIINNFGNHYDPRD